MSAKHGQVKLVSDGLKVDLRLQGRNITQLKQGHSTPRSQSFYLAAKLLPVCLCIFYCSNADKQIIEADWEPLDQPCPASGRLTDN